MSSWDQSNRGEKHGLVWRNRKKISQIINNYRYLPFFLLIIYDGYLGRMKHCGCMEDDNKKEREVMEVEKDGRERRPERGMGMKS